LPSSEARWRCTPRTLVAASTASKHILQSLCFSFSHGSFLGSSSLSIVLPLSRKECNHELRASISGSRLTKPLVNIIHIYGSKIICYENTFHS
jgi:citrate lyase alpha subunit